MKRFRNLGMSFLIALLMIMSFVTPVVASSSNIELDRTVEETAQFMYNAVQNPQVGSVGGEWAVLGLARSGYDVPEEYYQRYYGVVENYVKSLDGNLHDKKYTEYSRLIVALTSIGKNPRDVGGYDLLKPLGDYDKTIWQGLNGPIWALIALDSGDYSMPLNENAETQATRDMYIQRILDTQLDDGGWSLFGGTSAADSGQGVSDPDITGMALQALAKYQDREDVKKATEEALECMSKQQNLSGGFESWGTENLESCVQIIVALAELGIPIDDPRFVKDGNTLLDNMMGFYSKGNGFLHTKDGSGSSQMASEQGFYGLVAAQRLKEGKNSLYRMSDAIKITKGLVGPSVGEGLENKNPDIKSMPIVIQGRTFDDISGVNAHKNLAAIEALASRKIIDGKTENLFDPDETMTRAEFSAIVVRGLGLDLKAIDKFEDVSKDAWYYKYVGTAFEYGIVQGTSDTTFNPQGTITREEAATMIARAAKLCGLETEMDSGAIRDVLAQFNDYVTTSDWARSSLAFCYGENILEQSNLDILPKGSILRSEIAQMLFNMLGLANLL